MKKKTVKTIEYGPVNELHGYKNVRRVENASCGLRLVGFADEVSRENGSRGIQHTGWFTDDDGCNGETYRGVVYQLPSRGGAQYVYGYADPNNNGCALLCFDPELDKMDAARAADRFAEIFAEEQRDYNRAWQAGRRYDDLADEIKDTRKEALTLGAEMREAKKAHVKAPTICATLRHEIMSLYKRIQKARKERKDLLDLYGTCEGFKE